MTDHDAPEPGPSPGLGVAQQRLGQQAAVGRKARRQRLATAVIGCLSTLTLLLAGGAWVLTSYVSSSIRRVDADTSGTPSSGPVNILVAGIDTRGGLTHRQERLLHVGHDVSANTDTMMLVHIPANHLSVQVVSLPRDSWVSIPGHGMNKINAADGIGGPRLMVATVEHATGLVINDYVEVDFLGFVSVINALGGVNICVPFAVNDHYSGLKLSAGRHHVEGVTALEFARDRHSFAQSDLARISDQQQLLSSVVSEVTSSGMLANPIRLQRFLSSLTAAIKVDRGFNLIRLADELRGLRPGDVTFTTVPLASVNYLTPTGESAVLWDNPAAKVLFTRLRNDTGRPAGRHHRRVHKHAKNAVTRRQVSVDVYNGTLVGGLSAATARKLAALGFTVHKAGLNWRRHNLKLTVIDYPPGQAAAAALLRKVLPGAVMRAVTGLARIRLVLGATGHSVTGASPSGQRRPAAAQGSIAVPGQQRTAAQAACR
ncbi:MAG: LCP family protein [Streptosporangiaceae bacterium]